MPPLRPRVSFATTIPPAWLASLLLLLCWGPRAECDADPQTIYQMWEEVSSLRAGGEFDRAVAVLSAITANPASSEGVLRRAHNHIVFTRYLMNDEEGARRAAREALERFPDLSADPIEFPPRVAATYDDLRREMFGSLAVSEPTEATISVDGRPAGRTPLLLPWIPAGEHDLVLSKPGHESYATRVRIDPGGKHTFEFSLERRRDTRWWLWRAGAAAVAGTLLVFTLGGDDDAAPGEASLPGPPPPPGD